MSKIVRRRWQSSLDGLSRRGRQGCEYESYIPDLLAERHVRLDGDVAADVADAEAAILRLNASAVALADTEALARLLLRAESVASSYIEGLVIGGRRLLHAEAARSMGDPPGDVTGEEVLGNIEAMTWAVDTLARGSTVTVDGLLEVHRRLLAGSRLADHAGRIRTEQNWIGGSSANPCSAAFVPPPPEHVPGLLADLCAFSSDEALPAVAQAAIAHAQFETIHPFVDGNGRTGRVLIHVILRRRGLAPRMSPPVSLVLATWSKSYIDGLVGTRYKGRPDSDAAHNGLNRWIALFAGACRRAVEDALDFERKVDDIEQAWRVALGRVRAGSAVELLLKALPGAPILSVRGAAELIGRSFQATNEAVRRLEAAGVVVQVTVGRRNRAYEARAIIDAFAALERQLASPVGDTRAAPPKRAIPARPEGLAKLTKRTTEQLRSYLSSLSADELMEVLLSHAARDDELRDRLLIESAKRGAGAVDLKSFQRSINAAVFDLAESRYGSEYTSGEWAYGVNQVAGRLGELLDAGQAAAVVTLAEHALAALVEVMERADDSSGYMSDLVAEFERLHHDACIAARPEPVELASRLFAWEVDGHWDVFMDAVSRYADVLGPEGVGQFRQLAEERWAQVRPAGPGDRDAERWGASYRITRVMERLAKLAGNVDELVAVKSRDLSMPYDWLEVAEVYAGAGRHEEALDWAERGVAAFPDQRDPRLDEFLCEAYHRAGRDAEAVDLAWRRFQSRPELATYQRLADHATKAGAWSEWRPQAVAVLRQRIDAGGPSVAPRRPGRGPVFEPVGASHLVEVLLWEGDDEAAWREAVDAGVPHRIWMRLGNIRQDEHPEDSIPIFQREVEQLIGTKNNRGYADAVAMMAHVCTLLANAGRPEDFGPYSAAVRTAHKAKRNLMRLLDQNGW